ncbi:MAG: PEP-CTERM sorting domain-containing protein [Leptolyngbyaceae cyanobacterium SL_7_1]|nr:PEP-CTERM sorting domain-containing protein [Leptolyngbyaceae cyanobacterium SL_7_1]
MKRVLFHGVGVASILTAVTLIPGVAALAATLTATSITGSWNNVVLTDGSVDGGGTLTGVGTDQIRWGTTEGDKSGFDFTASSTPLAIDTEIDFSLGEFTHFNFPVFPPSVTSADLNVSLDFGGTVQAFTYTFTNEETTNTIGGCPAFQQSTTACDDRITFGTGFTSSSFLIGTQEYTLQLVGFVESGSTSVVSEFITEENAANRAALVGRLTTPPPVETVPEPMAIAALSVVGTFLIVRRRSTVN